jgi:hypothetical protein
VSGNLASYRRRIAAAMYPDAGRAPRGYGAANRETARPVIKQYRVLSH